MIERLEELVMRAAVAEPDRTAIVDATGSWRYRELDRASDRVAMALERLGIVEGDRVAFWAPKTRHVVAVMQGALRVGAAYVPIDPATPAPRARKILADCGVRCLVASAAYVESAGFGGGVLPLDELVALDLTAPSVGRRGAARPTSELAYVLYTSGSTGTPKGVCLSHANALAFIHWAVGELVITGPQVFANHAAFNFDLSVFDLYAAFSVGGTVCLVPETVAYSAAGLWDFLARHRIDIWYSVPSVLMLLMAHTADLGTVPAPRVVIFAGEPFPIPQLRRLKARWPASRMFNFYGPTETNVCTSYELTELADDQIVPVPIGGPACGNRVWAVTDTGREAVAGESGELYVEGPTVMLGYWGGAPHEGPYRTGDICVRRADGDFEFVGRLDQMVKIRGHRIELGEIEAVLAQHPDVLDVAVVAAGDGLDRRLVGFVVGRQDRTPSLIDLKAFAAKSLPRYMLIDQRYPVAALPRTANGKVDRRALAASADAAIG